MSNSYRFINQHPYGLNYVTAESIDDSKQGSVIWLQTSADGCYVPLARLAELIAGLKTLADNKGSTAA